MSIVSMSLGSTAARLSAISEEAPQSMRQRKPPDSMRMQVCRRPPLPNASPLPKNRIRTCAISFGSPPNELWLSGGVAAGVRTSSSTVHPSAPNACWAAPASNGSRGDTLDDRQQETRWYHAVQGETRLKIEIPELVLSALPAPATH